MASLDSATRSPYVSKPPISHLHESRRGPLILWGDLKCDTDKRENQLEPATGQTAGMYGDLSGIIGATLPAIEHLNPQVSPAPEADGA